MIKNKYIGIALVSLLVLILGTMVAIIVMLGNERSLHASGAAVGRHIMVTMRVNANEDALAVMDTSKNTIVVYRCWNGSTFYPVSGRRVDQDHRIFDLLKHKQFNNIRSLNPDYMPDAIEKRLEQKAKG